MAAPKKPEAEKPDEAKVAEEEVQEPKRSKVLQVTAPLVSLVVGKSVIQLRQGDVLPKDASAESVKHLADLGFIAEV